MKALLITAITSLALLTSSCMENGSNKDDSRSGAIFPKGELGPAENFTGKAWNTGLVAIDSIYNTVVEMFTLNREQEAIGTFTHQVRFWLSPMG